METSFFDSSLFSVGIMPLLIFLARICDVSIGTMRIIFVSKGKKYIAPFLGFFEVLIWIIAISKIMENLDNYVNYVAYAAGFATGNFVGMLIEEKLAMGIQIVRVFTNQTGHKLVVSLNNMGYGATSIEALGANEKVNIIYTIVPRNELNNVLDIINHFDPKTFYTIEDIRATNEGIFPQKKVNEWYSFGNIIRQWRKGK
jgi:uncharacterized protein YebE (UPF0316 family)